AIICTQVEGFAYEVAPMDSVDHHLATAGGLKLYVVPVGGVTFADAFADFSTTEHPHLILRRAVAATPAEGTLVLPNSSEEVECEVPADGDRAIFSVNKPMTILKGRTTLKIKRDAEAYKMYNGDWRAIAVTSSNV